MTSPAEARRVLQLSADADVAAVRAAWRRLAKEIHPDVPGGSTAAMQRVNDAVAVLLGQEGTGEMTGAPARPERDRREPSMDRVAHDDASFVVEALPEPTFEALLVVTSWLGEVVVDEPPYQLDVLLLDPLRCWCRLDLLPDAGASTVSLTIAAFPDEPLPDLDDVRDLWVSALNHLGSG